MNNVKKKSRYPFKGEDWTELANFFDIRIPEKFFGETQESQVFIDFLESQVNEEDETFPEVINACRAFLGSLIDAEQRLLEMDSIERCFKHSRGYVEICKGLYDTVEDHVFMKFFKVFLPHMWTT